MEMTGKPVASSLPFLARGWASSFPFALMHTGHQLLYGRCVLSCLATSVAFGLHGEFLNLTS